MESNTTFTKILKDFFFKKEKFKTAYLFHS